MDVLCTGPPGIEAWSSITKSGPNGIQKLILSQREPLKIVLFEIFFIKVLKVQVLYKFLPHMLISAPLIFPRGGKTKSSYSLDSRKRSGVEDLLQHVSVAFMDSLLQLTVKTVVVGSS